MKAYNELDPSQLDFSKVPDDRRALRVQQFADWKADKLEPRVVVAYEQWIDAAIEREEVVFVGPGLLKKAANLTKAVTAQAFVQVKLVPPAVKVARLEQCHKNLCGMFDLKNVKCKHPKCGCGLRVKAGWSTQECPVNLWPRLTVLMEIKSDSNPKTERTTAR